MGESWCKRMMVEVNVATLLTMMCIPTFMSGFFLWKLHKREVARDALEDARKMKDLLFIQGIRAAISLGEASARVIRRNNPESCNGEMSMALEYAQKVKLKQKEFFDKQGIENLHS